MNWTQIKRSKADVLFSRYLRLLRKKCGYCGRGGSGPEGITGLQASHYHGRRKESVRWDEENVDCFCISCHRELGTNNRKAYDTYKLKELGEKRFNALLIRANTSKLADEKLAELYYRQKLKELEHPVYPMTKEAKKHMENKSL